MVNLTNHHQKSRVCEIYSWKIYDLDKYIHMHSKNYPFTIWIIAHQVCSSYIQETWE
jgi:hypothetical protein